MHWWRNDNDNSSSSCFFLEHMFGKISMFWSEREQEMNECTTTSVSHKFNFLLEKIMRNDVLNMMMLDKKYINLHIHLTCVNTHSF